MGSPCTPKESNMIPYMSLRAKDVRMYLGKLMHYPMQTFTATTGKKY